MEKILKHLSTLILLFLLISGIIILYQTPENKPAPISLSELVTEINQDQVKTIVVQSNALQIELQDGKKQTASKESESSLSETLANYGIDKEKLKNVSITVKEESGFGFWLATILPFLLPFILIGAFIWFMMRQAQRGNAQALSFGTSRARMTDPKDKKKRTTFADVAGAQETKMELEEVVDFLKHPKKFLAMGAKIPKGVLLLGPPGTGKTLMAKAVAGEAGVPFFNISGSEFVEMFVGVGASRVRDLFKQAKKNAPAIVFIDEIDAVGRHRGAGLGGGHDEREQTLNQILVEMDGFETDTSVIVIAATNRPDVLDPALLRPGRFDRRVTMDLPDINEREQILAIHTKNKPLEDTVKLRVIAERTPGFSGADLANLVNEGAILATRRNKKTIGMPELTESIEKVILGPERRSRVINPEEKKIIAYHEGGHALVGASLEYADPVQKVSIISRGHAGGYTLAVPSEDKSLHSYKYFIDELAMLLGGYASETLIFGDITTGPSSDLERATQMARNMVTRYGMSRLGARTFGKKDELVFLGREMHEERNYSEKTAQDIDIEVSHLIDEAFKRATDILTEKRAILDTLARTLLEKETLEKDEFNAIVGITAPKEIAV
ncbi:MAG: cell division protein FtsH [Candidatus Moranbacteria bacterium RIFCSPHIGHO2_12_FULL_54_9]|nr:MAG: cell division protein FtsH [Candidatus Moranbacteria bacterium RIFCSPHIGHO2_01_FULL_54_31]OGI26397.1 MAG: cell division protein FtsH [Candidatus Moranbacteria bacterium RIFCSPHIGHO2_12_FULL_54_9]